MRIGIDIDGVLTNYENFIRVYGTKFNYEENIEMKNLDFSKYDEQETYNWTNEQYEKFWNQYLEWYATKYPAREYSSEILKTLKNRGNEIIIITARNNEGLPKEKHQEMKVLVKQWLKENDIIYDKLIFSESSKRKICIEEKIDVMVDDSPYVLEELKNDIKTVCFDASYNKNIETIRVYEWYQLLQILTKHNKSIII